MAAAKDVGRTVEHYAVERRLPRSRRLLIPLEVRRAVRIRGLLLDFEDDRLIFAGIFQYFSLRLATSCGAET